MSRRRRCSGKVCGGVLHEAGELTQVAKGEYLCQRCLLAAADVEADDAKTPAEKRHRVAGIRKKKSVSDPGAQIELENADGQGTASSSSASADDEPSEQGEAGDALPASPDRLADAIESGVVMKASSLPAPTIQADVEIDLGSPEEKLAERRDLPNVKVDGWPLRYGRISASSLGTFFRCPEQFRRQYVEGVRTPGSAATISGNAAHVALDAYFRAQLAGSEAPRSLWSQWADAKFDYEVDQSGGTSEVDWGKTNADHARFRAKASVDAYIVNVAKTLHPVAVDQVFVRQVAGVPVPLVGFLDLVEERAIIDWKFTAQVKRETVPDWRAQGLLYLLARDLPLRWHAVGWPKKDGTCSMNTGLELGLTAENHRIATSLARSCVEAILSYTKTFGVAGPWPGALTHTWACNSCFFRERGCDWWPHEGSPVPEFGEASPDPVDPF